MASEMRRSYVSCQSCHAKKQKSNQRNGQPPLHCHTCTWYHCLHSLLVHCCSCSCCVYDGGAPVTMLISMSTVTAAHSSSGDHAYDTAAARSCSAVDSSRYSICTPAEADLLDSTTVRAIGSSDIFVSRHAIFVLRHAIFVSRHAIFVSRSEPRANSWQRDSPVFAAMFVCAVTQAAQYCA